MFGCSGYPEHPNSRIFNFPNSGFSFLKSVISQLFKKHLQQSILSSIFVELGSTLDLTANAILVGKHVERCDEARKYLVANYN